MLSIFRKVGLIESVVCSISDRNATFKEAVMSINEVQVSVVVDDVLTIIQGDYIKLNGINYKLNRDAEYTVKSVVEFQYDLIFEHPLYTLFDKLYTHKITGSSIFQLTGKLVDFVEQIVWNINLSAENPMGVDTGWSVNALNVVDTDYKNISFSANSCRDVLTLLAKEFNAEFYLVDKQINFVDHIENATGLTFTQGQGNGLYEISQKNVDTNDTITRVYPVGGNKNVPNTNADDDGNLKLTERYLENFTDYPRVVEKRVVFEDVFPHFLGNADTVSGLNNCEIICNAIDFDFATIAVGDNARINFLTGDLMGIAFKFQWNNSLKKITLLLQDDEVALKNEDGTTPQVPNALKKAIAGDKFNFTGVIMPIQYVNTAITKLREKATSWLLFYSRKRVKFDLSIDYRWMRGKTPLKSGDIITITIPQKSISKLIRVTSIDKNLYTGAISATVSNYLDERWEKKIEGQISSLTSTVQSALYGEGVDILERYDARPLSDRNVMSSLRSAKNFLRKDIEDVASERITFDKGAVVRDLATKDFNQDKFAGSGAGIYHDISGSSVLEVDKLNVRKEAWFNEVIINQIRFQGGIVVYSAANLEVLSVTDSGSYLEVKFDTKDGQIANQFMADDQIRCQRFSGGSVIKYYMSRVTSIGVDYIRLSKTDKDGTLNVEVGDAIVQFGSRTNTLRQSLIEVNVLDGGKQTFYQNVNSYTLTDKNYIDIGRVLVDGVWKNMIRSYGDAYFGARDLSSYIKYDETTELVEIRADVKFLSSGEYKSINTGLSEAQAAAELDAARLAGIAQSEAIRIAGENATVDVATINAKLASLQSQVDGEISNWFYSGGPTGANNPVFNVDDPWDTDPKKTAHIGDTYTCIDTYAVAPTIAGKSWRYSTSFTWVAIADSDAVLALQKAATAQSTADGKSTTYLAQPAKYKAGDVWVLAADWNGFKSGEMLNASQDSASFVSGHWTKKVKYTDDSAVNNLVIGGRNLINKSTPKSVFNLTVTDFNHPDCPNGFMGAGINGDNSATFVRYHGIKSNGWWTLSFDMRGSQNGAYPLRADINDLGEATFVMNADNTWKRFSLTVNVTNYGDGSFYNFINFRGLEWLYYFIKDIKLEKGNKATEWSPAPEDVAADILTAQTAATNAASAATTANTAIGVLANDDVISAAIEKPALKKEWDIIFAEKLLNDAQADLFSVSKTDYGTQYTSLSAYIGTNLNVLTTDWTLGAGGGATLRTKFSNYYSERTKLLNAIATKAKEAGDSAQTNLNNLVIGGRNLLKNSDFQNGITGWHNYAAAGTYPVITVLYTGLPIGALQAMQIVTNAELQGIWYLWAFDVNKQYTLSFSAKASIASNISCGYESALQIKALTTSWQRFSITFTCNAADASKNLVFYKSTAGTYFLTNMQLEVGSKATDWKRADEDVQGKIDSYKFLKDAIVDGSTEINGGLLATNLLRMKDATGKINGGMSGLPDNVGFWTGGTYVDALAGIAKIILRKDGSGQLACGNINWDLYGNLIIKALIRTAVSGARLEIDSANNSMTIFDDSGLEKVKVSPKNVMPRSEIGGAITVVSTTYAARTNELDVDGNVGIGSTEIITLDPAKIYTLAIPTVSYSASASGFSNYDGVNKIWTYWFGSASILMKLVDVTTGLVVWSINKSVASYTSNNIAGTIGGITLAGMRGSVYRIDVLITIANDEDCFASATASIAAGQILSGTVVNTISEIGFDGFNFINSATDFLHYGLDGFFRRGATDIPAGLGGGQRLSGGTSGSTWGLAHSSTRTTTTTTTIYHNITDTKFTVNVIPRGSFTWYLSSVSASSSDTSHTGTIIIVCSIDAAVFDYVIVRTPY